MKDLPRRFKLAIGDNQFIYGCYFPNTDVICMDHGGRDTGTPIDVEWIDEEVPEYKVSTFNMPRVTEG